MKKIIFSFLLFFGLLTTIQAQQNPNNKFGAIYSYLSNNSDTVTIQSNRTTLSSFFGNTGVVYFDKQRNKWRIWNGTAYQDLLSNGGLYSAGSGLTLNGTTFRFGGTLTQSATLGGNFAVNIGQTALRVGAIQLAGTSGIFNTTGNLSFTTNAILSNTGNSITSSSSTSQTHSSVGSYTINTGENFAVNAGNALSFETSSGSIFSIDDSQISLQSDNLNNININAAGDLNLTGSSTNVRGQTATLTNNSGIGIIVEETQMGITTTGPLYINSIGALIDGPVDFTQKATFNINSADIAGLNVGSYLVDPTTTLNGDLWYNLTTGFLRTKVNGSNVSLLNTSSTIGTNQVPYGNNSSTLLSEANFNYNPTTDLLNVPNASLAGNLIVQAAATFSFLSSGQIPYAVTAGAINGENALTYNPSTNNAVLQSTSGNNTTSIFGGEIRLNDIGASDIAIYNHAGIQASGLTDYQLTNSSGDVSINGIAPIRTTFTFDFPSVSGGNRSATNLLVSGVAEGDVVIVTESNAVASGIGGCYDFHGFVSAPGQLTIHFNNCSTLASDPPNGSYAIVVLKQ